MNWNLPLSKDPVFEIFASLSHCRLGVPLDDMTLGFEYENNNIVIYFTVKNLILLLQKSLLELLVIERGQKQAKKRFYFL